VGGQARGVGCEEDSAQTKDGEKSGLKIDSTLGISDLVENRKVTGKKEAVGFP
jgi:hypothetical protein